MQNHKKNNLTAILEWGKPKILYRVGNSLNLSLMKNSILVIQIFICIFLISTLISCNNVEKEWNKATVSHTIDGYKSFLKKYPQSIYDSIAYLKLSDLEWNRIEKGDSLEVFLLYQKEYPKSLHLNNIKDRLPGLRKISLIRSIDKEPLNKIQQLVNDGTNISEIFDGSHVSDKETAGLTPIHIAAYYCRNDIIQFFISKKADINIKGADDSTPLHWAARAGCLDIIKSLIDNGADINNIIEDGGTIYFKVDNDTELGKLSLRKSRVLGAPLHWAAENNKIDAVQLLLDLGADVNSITKHGISPLHFAANSGNEKMVELLIKRGAKIQDSRYIYCQPIHYSSNKAVISYLLAKGAKLNSQSDFVGLPIHNATSMGYKEAVEFYLDNGIDVNSLGMWSCDLLGRGANVTPLWTAAYVGNFDSFKYLESKGGNINFKTKENEIGGSILHAAAWGGNVDLVNYLIGKIKNLDIPAEIPTLILMSSPWENITPLGVACHYGNLDVVKMLIEAGADKNFKINKNWSPITVAMISNKTDVVKYLLDTGAKFDYKLNEIDNLYTNDEIKQVFKAYLNNKTSNVLK